MTSTTIDARKYISYKNINKSHVNSKVAYGDNSEGMAFEEDLRKHFGSSLLYVDYIDLILLENKSVNGFRKGRSCDQLGVLFGY